MMDICTFWFGKRLRPIDRLCLMSMVMTGQKVKLYTHQAIENVPKGVELHDAEPILPLSVLYQLDPDFPDYIPAISIVQFSDLFRVMLMKQRQGVWLDTDVYLVKPFTVAEGEVWLAGENKNRVGVSALYLPADNPIIEAFDNYRVSGAKIPDWLGFKRRRLIPAYLQLTAKPIRPNRLGITVFGNDGISRLAKRYGFFTQRKPKETFYYWTAKEALRIFDPAYGLEPLNDKNFIGFHVHRKGPTTLKPQPGSFYHWAVNRIPAFHDLD